MRLTPAKSIGGGFMFLLVCTGIMASLSIDVMKRADEGSESAAPACPPILMLFNSSAGNLLQGAYHMRVFFAISGIPQTFLADAGIPRPQARIQGFAEAVARGTISPST